IAAAVASVILSYAGKQFLPGLPFLDRMGLVFLVALALAVLISLMVPARANANRIVTSDISYGTSATFNMAGLGVVLLLIAFYATWW
ncbi:MAG TPA: sodium transporter, partial [Rhizorhapis sp.]|nr:sodium transporter [Rhizorhapis sp.]